MRNKFPQNWKAVKLWIQCTSLVSWVTNKKILLKLFVSTTDGADNNETLEDMVLFWTGCPSLPPDVTTKLLVKYLENHPSKVLAESSTCTLELSIPVVHNDYSVFKDYLNKSISYGKLGFGKI